MSRILGELMSESMISYENPPEWDGLAELAENLADGTRFSLSSNVEMFLLFVNGSWDHADYIGEANFSVNANILAEGGLSLGEGVEVKAGGGVGISTNFLTISAKEYDEPTAPLLYSADGTESSASMQSLTLTARGYDWEMHTFTSNFVKDAKYPTGGYYEIWAPVPRLGADLVTLRAKAFSSYATVRITMPGAGSVIGTGEINCPFLLSAGAQVYGEVTIISYDGPYNKGQVPEQRCGSEAPGKHLSYKRKKGQIGQRRPEEPGTQPP